MMMTFRKFNGSMKTTMVGVRILISSLFFHKNAIFLRESVRIRTHHVQILCMCFVYTTNKKVQNCGKTTTSGITNQKIKDNTRRVITMDQARLGLSKEYLDKGFNNPVVKAYFK